MLVSYKWLSEFLDLKAVSAKELADQLSITGIEVEGIDYPQNGLKKVVVGEVLECVDHPDSDHLHICQVNIGAEKPTQIICGAPNIKAKIKVIVALPGARIVGNVKIKKGKMRGEISNGMICSLQEIGYADAVVPKEYADGIYYLPEDAIPGKDVYPYLSMDDAIIDLSITPNRADALSMRGVAYEVGAMYRQTPKFEVLPLVEGNQKAGDKLSVNVAVKEVVPSYQIRVIENVTIAPSPRWLQNLLMNEGIRPINNVVDITNYILLLYGQPLHAFDYDQLKSDEILVRYAKNAEELTTLDGEKRQLTEQNIVITNGDVPVALAGVMGGLDSEITSKTTTVALESALFDSTSIRKTAQQFNLRSESSARFEKGINKATIDEACDQAAAWIAKLSGGTVLNGAIKACQIDAPDREVAITLDRINQYLGTALSLAEVGEIFDALGFGYVEKDHKFVVRIPARRWDIAIEADLVEEVARIYGYNRLPSTLPKGETILGTLTSNQKKTRSIRTILESDGLDEAISYALTTEAKSTQFNWIDSLTTRLDWPMTEDRSVLRLNLVSGLLDDVAYNIARKNQQLGFYEIGRVFYQHEDPLTILPHEENHLALALTGQWQERDWQTKAEKVDFFYAKGILEHLFAELSLSEAICFEKSESERNLHPGRTAAIYLADEKIGFVGQIHPSVAKSYEIPETYVAEINLDAVLNYETDFTYQPVSKYPSVSRDIALSIAETVTNEGITLAIKEVAGRFLQAIQLFDVYQGDNIEKGKKSLAYRLTFVDPEATLTDEQINQTMNKILKKLTEELHATVR